MKPKTKPQIHRVVVTISRPMGADPGTIEEGHFFIDDGVVVLCACEGTPITRKALRVGRSDGPAPLVRWERKLRPGEDTARAARELLMTKYNATKRGSDQHRPLIYPRVVY